MSEAATLKIQTLPLQIGRIFGFITNCYLLAAGSEAQSLVVIDPADGVQRILKAVSGRKVDAIILTHRHADHTAAAAELVQATGAVVYAHELDAPAIQQPEGHYPHFSRESRQPPKVDVLLHDRDRIELADIAFEVLHTPGHSVGSICLYVAAAEALFSGDTLFYGTTGRTDLPTGDAAAMHDSLVRLSALPDCVRVYPGHDQSTTIAAERHRALIEY
ncbi:MAG: MBL fold metallo-hydrolase [Coriobacteriales bacterium]|jgi:glyoxylase-like metal-dependent hydrolase (beta-lactamase superfamily II)|nr:MBL fold metallo-hydrolase [Coriobacteriales bacterium]